MTDNSEDYPGLANLGATCYINSVLQCLKFSPSIIEHMLNKKEHANDLKILELINDFDQYIYLFFIFYFLFFIFYFLFSFNLKYCILL